MSAVRPQDLIAYVGGDALLRFGTFSRRTQRIARGGEQAAEVFTRADASTCATYVGADGLVHLAAAGILRPQFYDLNGDGIYETCAPLIEPAGTNSLAQSQAMATAPWTTNLLTVTNNVAAVLAPDGTQTASSLVPTAVSSNLHDLNQSMTITSGEFIAVSTWVRQGAYSGLVFRFSDAGSTHGFQMVVDLAAGTILSSAAIGAGGSLLGAQMVPYPNGWYRLLLWGLPAGAIVTATPFFQVYDTGAHANSATAFTGDGVSGIYAWGCQVERNGVTFSPPPSSYIPTTTVAVTRAGEGCLVPIGVSPPAVGAGYTVHFKVIPTWGLTLGTLGGSAPGIFSLGSSNGGIAADGKALMDCFYASVGGSLSTRLVANGVQVSNAAAIAAAAVMEGVVQLTPSALQHIATIIAQGNQASTTAQTIATLPWRQQQLLIGDRPNGGLTTSSLRGGVQRIVVAQGIHTLAEMQAVP